MAISQSTSGKPKFAERALVRLIADGEIEIDAAGRIWRRMKRQWDKWSQSVRVVPCKLHRAENRLKCGYLTIRTVRDGERLICMAHRLVWQWLCGDIPEGLQVNHKNGRKDDNRLENLELVTQSGNLKHAVRHGLMRVTFGERSATARLSEADVLAIREARTGDDPPLFSEIAARYGISKDTAQAIVKGRKRKLSPGPVSLGDQRRGRSGATNIQARLSERDVLEIRRRRAGGESLRAIAADYDVSWRHVSSIALRRTWKHLT